MRMTVVFVVAALTFVTPQRSDAQQSTEQNLQTCLSGKYPALCRHDLLSPEERVRVRSAELRENLGVCLTGKYPALCNHSELTAEQAAAVSAAERAENFSVCSTGKYPALCNHAILSPDERLRVTSAETAENLRICMDGRYPILCQRSLLTPEQTKDVDAAEAKAVAVRPSTGSATSSRCFETTIMSPTPFMGNNAEIFKLADGSRWEVKYEYEYLYEYYPSVVVCPSRGTLAIRGKTLNVQQLSTERPSLPTPSRPALPSSADVIESQIDGEFSGWEGETIFKLRNGQIWQQSSYAYKYKYAYSPKVLIYKSGSVYKMRVDGVDGEISVIRLK